jgi:DNA-binding winged helix-turn-helix (wHTH) protein
VLDFAEQWCDMEPIRQKPLVRFGTYEVSLHSGEIRKSGARIRVQQQPLKVLEILLERPGQVVSREDLRDRVWPHDSFGDFDQAVNIAIAKLRNALGDSADNPRFIETLPKRGYRFIADVRTVDSESPAKNPELAVGDLREIKLEPQPQAAKSGHRSERQVRPMYRIAIASTVILALAALGIWQYRARSVASAGIRSLAVLPLENLSGDASQDILPTA